METVDLEMEDLFDDQAGEDGEDFGAAPPALDDEDRPMDQEEGMEATQGEGDGDVLDRLRDISKGAAKKRVMNPQPKLNAERLRGNRGLPVLPKIFNEVKFRGKGHEASDLKLLMGKLEHWGHRMFPKLPFDDLIERMEKLGNRKDVQNCVKRIRLEMPMLDEDYVQQYDDEDDENQPPKEDENNEPRDNFEEDFDAEEAFDEMIREEKERQQTQQKAKEPMAATGVTSDEDPELEAMNSPAKPAPGTSEKTASPKKKAMSDELRERIERNKRLAMERRMKRLGTTPNKGAPSPSRDTPTKTPSASSTSQSQDETVSSELQSGQLQMTESQGATQSVAAASSSTQNDDPSLRLHLSESQSEKEAVDGERTDGGESENLHLQMTETPTQLDSMEDGQNKLTETEATDSTLKSSIESSSSPVIKSSDEPNTIDEGEEMDVEKDMETAQETLNIHVRESESVEKDMETGQETLNLHLTESESVASKDKEGEKGDVDGSEMAAEKDTETSQESSLNLCLTESESVSKEAKEGDVRDGDGESNSGGEGENDKVKTGTSGEDTLQLKLSLSDNETAGTDTSLEDAAIS